MSDISEPATTLEVVPPTIHVVAAERAQVVAQDNRNPWDQQDGEDDHDYLQFLFYLNMGMERNVTAAARAWRRLSREQREKAGDLLRMPQEGEQPSKSWSALAQTWDWRRRAVRYDIHMMQTEGAEAVTLFVAGIKRAAAAAYAAFDPENGVKITRVSEAIKLLSLVGGYVPQETVERLQADAADNRTPRLGG